MAANVIVEYTLVLKWSRWIWKTGERRRWVGSNLVFLGGPEFGQISLAVPISQNIPMCLGTQPPQAITESVYLIENLSNYSPLSCHYRLTFGGYTSRPICALGKLLSTVPKRLNTGPFCAPNDETCIMRHDYILKVIIFIRKRALSL